MLGVWLGFIGFCVSKNISDPLRGVVFLSPGQALRSWLRLHRPDGLVPRPPSPGAGSANWPVPVCAPRPLAGPRTRQTRKPRNPTRPPGPSPGGRQSGSARPRSARNRPAGRGPGLTQVAFPNLRANRLTAAEIPDPIRRRFVDGKRIRPIDHDTIPTRCREGRIGEKRWASSVAPDGLSRTPIPLQTIPPR